MRIEDDYIKTIVAETKRRILKRSDFEKLRQRMRQQASETKPIPEPEPVKKTHVSREDMGITDPEHVPDTIPGHIDDQSFWDERAQQKADSLAGQKERELAKLKKRRDAGIPGNSWGKLNLYLYDRGHKYFVSSSRPGTFYGESLDIPTMEKKMVVFPVKDEKTGETEWARGFKDIKAIRTLGVFSGPIYEIKFKLKSEPEMGVMKHITTDHRLYEHPAVERTSRRIDPGVWIKGDSASRIMSGRRNTLDLKIKMMAVEAGLIEDYQFTKVERKLKKALGVD